MNHDDTRFDSAMRALHAQAVGRVSPQVRQRLRAARSVPARAPRMPGWGLASGCAALFGLVLALQWQAPTQRVPPPADPTAVSARGADVPAGAATSGTDVPVALAALEQNPDFYLWLASNDSGPPATHLE